MPHGTVRWFDPAKGFGFLAPADAGEDAGADVFVHASEVLSDGGPRVLREGQEVQFEVGEGPRGPQALEVRVTSDVAPDAPLGVLGTVTWYEPGKGYGFATPDGGGADVFVHSSAIVTGGVLTTGQRVAFLTEPGEKGPQATNVIPLGGAAGLAPAGDGADGTVTWYDEGKGFGFITPDVGSEDVFVHARSLVEGLEYLAEGDRVAFTVAAGDRGPLAREVSLVAEAGSADAAPPASAPTAAAKAGEGVVARYDADRGFGFVTPDAGGPDLFVHVSTLIGAESLEVGDRVRFAVRQSDRGPQADKVERLA
ncbi:MAG: cspA [Frankiales bacterium]|nr:cspA [Frankiales bacterium]